MRSTSEGRKSVFVILIGVSMLLSVPSSAWGDAPLKVTIDANSVLVNSGQKPLLRYSYGDVPFKPYVKELFTPNGLNVLRDAPHDHLHHHALMFAVAVDGVNYWEETPVSGRQRHTHFSDTVVEEGRLPNAGFSEELVWTDPSDQGALHEQRTVRVCRTTEPEATVMLWRSQLSVPKGKPGVTLTGAHYFGLGMRFIQAMDGVGSFRNAGDKAATVFRGEEKLVRSDWCAYAAAVDGKDVTVAMFGHPDNVRHPTMWFTMVKPFAYLSAMLGLHEEPLKVAAGQPLDLRYGVALWDGAVASEEIDRLYQQWVKVVSK